MTQQRESEGQGRGLWRGWLRNAFSRGAAIAFRAARVSAVSSSAPGSAGSNSDVDPPLPRGQAELRTDTAEAGPGLDRAAATDKPSAVLLPFPIRGEALLVRLADLLRRRVGDDRPRRDPFLFALSRWHGSRLTLDYQSYVEFVDARAEFRFAIDVAPNTSISITTADFDALVEFVVQYVSARLGEVPALEAAS